MTLSHKNFQSSLRSLTFHFRALRPHQWNPKNPRMRALSPLSIFSLSLLHHLHFKSFTFLFSSSAFPSSSIPNTNPKSLIVDYLIDTFGVSKARANIISNRFPLDKFPEQPQSVIKYLQEIGFTETQIRASIVRTPRLLTTGVEKTLKPKVEFLQKQGLKGYDLGEFIAKNPFVLYYSLSNRLIPCIEILKKILINDDDNNEKLIKVMRRCGTTVIKNPQSGLLCNVAFLQSCGIVGSQLSMLLIRYPYLFVMKESAVRERVSRVLNMGFSVHSRMLVHALDTVLSLSDVNFRRKLDLFQSYGFSEDECMQMSRRAPSLFRISEEKLKLGIEFFTTTLDFDMTLFIQHPKCLLFSMENRVIPRYRVLQLIKSKRLLKKEPSFINMLLYLTDKEFMEKFISKFRDEAEELLVAYKGHLLSSSDSDN